MEQEAPTDGFYVKVGDEMTFSKTIGESDVYLFTGITGDFAPIHIDEQYMQGTTFGRRVVQGVLLIGFIATASSILIDKFEVKKPGVQSYSAGYDRIRFTKPVFIGDTVTVTYRIVYIDHDKQRSKSDVEVRNQRGELVTVANHLIQWVKADAN